MQGGLIDRASDRGRFILTGEKAENDAGAFSGKVDTGFP
jgi:hypothetical protein